MQEILDRLPTKWHCIKCERGFPFLPDAEFPFAMQLGTDANGRRAAIGDICRECYDKASA